MSDAACTGTHATFVVNATSSVSGSDEKTSFEFSVGSRTKH